MISAGRVESNNPKVTGDAASRALYNDAMAGKIQPATAKKVGIKINEHAEYNRVTGFGNGGINAARFADKAPVSAANDVPPHVSAMVAAIESSPPDVGGNLLSLVIKNTKS